jgi:hypothetical protein
MPVYPGAIQAKRLLHGAPQTARICNAAEFVGRARASPEEADEGVGLRPTIYSGPAAAYLLSFA